MGLTTGDMVVLWMNDSSLNKRRVGDVVLVVQLVLVGDVVLDNQATPRSQTGCEKQLSTYSRHLSHLHIYNLIFRTFIFFSPL